VALQIVKFMEMTILSINANSVATGLFSSAGATHTFAPPATIKLTKSTKYPGKNYRNAKVKNVK